MWPAELREAYEKLSEQSAASVRRFATVDWVGLERDAIVGTATRDFEHFFAFVSDLAERARHARDLLAILKAASTDGGLADEPQALEAMLGEAFEDVFLVDVLARPALEHLRALTPIQPTEGPGDDAA